VGQAAGGISWNTFLRSGTQETAWIDAGFANIMKL